MDFDVQPKDIANSQSLACVANELWCSAFDCTRGILFKCLRVHVEKQKGLVWDKEKKKDLRVYLNLKISKSNKSYYCC